jgi:hypothetical protein
MGGQMKTLAALTTLVFAQLTAQLSHATFSGETNVQTPVLRCYNKSLQAMVYRLSNEKEYQIVVKDLNTVSAQKIMVKALVWPVRASNGNQMFINPNTSLIVGFNGGSAQGFLSLNRSQPNIGQIMICETLFNVLPHPKNLAAE